MHKRRFSPHLGIAAAAPPAKVARAGSSTPSRFCPHAPLVPLSDELVSAPRPPGPSVYTAYVPMHGQALSREPIQQLSRAQDLFDLLRDDPSPHALCPGKPEQLLAACEASFTLVDSAFALRTTVKDIGSWVAWDEYCSVMGTSPWRLNPDPQSDFRGFLREIVLLSNALLYFMKTRKPRSNKDAVIRPASAMAILYAAQRVHSRNHLSMVPLRHMVKSVKGLMRQFVKDYGPQSLVPKRREPMTAGLVKSIALSPAAVGASLQQKSFAAATNLAASSGFRKAELFQSDSETDFMNMANLCWFLDGKPCSNPTSDQLANLDERCYAVITPPRSKADQFGLVFSAHPVYLPFRHTVRNAAKALAALVMARMAHGAASSGPLFINDDLSACTAQQMSASLFRALTALMPAERAKLYTWHSHRIGFCSRLAAAGVPDATIQTLLRWQSADSLRTYKRISMQDQASFIDRSAEACVAAVQTSNLPIIEQFDFFVALNNLVQEE